MSAPPRHSSSSFCPPRLAELKGLLHALFFFDSGLGRPLPNALMYSRSLDYFPYGKSRRFGRHGNRRPLGLSRSSRITHLALKIFFTQCSGSKYNDDDEVGHFKESNSRRWRRPLAISVAVSFFRRGLVLAQGQPCPDLHRSGHRQSRYVTSSRGRKGARAPLHQLRNTLFPPTHPNSK